MKNATVQLTSKTTMVTAVKLVKTGSLFPEAESSLAWQTTAADLAREYIGANANESVLVFFLDRRLRLIAYQQAFAGTVDKCTCDPRVIFQTALLCNASRVIIAHNHPSGSVEPSEIDRDAMRRIAAAGDLLGIELTDALVVTADHAYSIESNEQID